MSRLIDILAIALLIAAIAAFAFGLVSLDAQEDFRALYLLLVGGAALRGATEILRPRGSSA